MALSIDVAILGSVLAHTVDAFLLWNKRGMAFDELATFAPTSGRLLLPAVTGQTIYIGTWHESA